MDINGNNEILKIFPNLSLTEYYKVTSPVTPEYNCIAWAANEITRWWWPIGNAYYWPPNVPREETIDAFIKAFATIGYILCNNCEVEHGFEKIAIYINKSGKPTHMARQLSNGKWTSKLGSGEDIEHKLDGLTGSIYGNIGQLLKRPKCFKT